MNPNGKRLRRLVVVGTAAAALLGVVPAVAGAATAGSLGGTLTYTAAPGERNALTIKQGTNAIALVDPEATIKPGARCTVDATRPGTRPCAPRRTTLVCRSISATAPTR